MHLVWLGVALMCLMPVLAILFLVGLHFHLCRTYLPFMNRIFLERPLFIVPRGQPAPEADDVRFPTSDGLHLCGCYLKTTGPRKGVILFGLEFGSNRWACVQYCAHLVEAGYDVFAYEPRNQGDSDCMQGYEPLQWLTEYDVEDARAAVRYLRSRPDADPHGIGFFGISKGAAAGLAVAAEDPYVRCFVTDGVYATYTVLVPYMRQWFRIYNSNYAVQGLLPSWYYGRVGRVGLRGIEREHGYRFVHIERRVRRLGQRPFLMIHGGGDTYIKPEMAEALFAQVRGPKEYWLVEDAKHNQALHLAGGEYERRVRAFFDAHLAPAPVRLPGLAPLAAQGQGPSLARASG
jgi:pimeloyl-ACP methyl ester carboxylesterase